jgi:hypothetical protein
MKSLAADLPFLFPPFFVFFRMVFADKYVIASNLPYNKKQNFNRVVFNDNPEWRFTIPLHASWGTLLYEIEIDYHENWPEKLKRMLSQAYGDSPYFSDYIHSVMNIYQRPSRDILELAMTITRFFLMEWQIDAQLEMEKVPEFHSKNENPIQRIMTNHHSDQMICDQVNLAYVKSSIDALPEIKYIDIRSAYHLLPEELRVKPHTSALGLLFNYGREMKRLFQRGNYASG